MRSRLKFDITTSGNKMIVILAARICIAVIGILFVPVYINLIGAESFGLVAFYGTLSSSLVILDFGLSAALSRETAILRTEQNSAQEIHNLIRSAEIINWIIGIVAGVVITLAAPVIARSWVQANALSVKEVEFAVMLMGGIFAFQFPASVYEGVLTGTQKQVSYILVVLSFTILKNVAVIAVLKIISSTIQAYFIWQGVFTLLLTLSLRFFALKYAGGKGIKPSFSKKSLLKIKKFAAGITGIALITFFLGQADKIIVSKFLLLDVVGYYSLAFLAAGAITQLLMPIQPVVYPKLTTLIAQANHEEATTAFHKYCRWVAIIAFLPGAVLIGFSAEILWVWTDNMQLTERTFTILRVAAAGTVLNCLMWIPYYFMLAKGNTKFTLQQNVITAIITVPLLIYLTLQFGAIGAAMVWLITNGGFVLISLPLFFRRFLPNEMKRWVLSDTAGPVAAAAIAVLGVKMLTVWFIPQPGIWILMILIAVAGVIYISLVPELRKLAWSYSAIIFKK